MARFNSDLIDDLARQKVVLFVGAGVSASATTRAGGSIKGWPAFLLDMCDHVGVEIAAQVKDLLKQSDYLLACEILQSALAEEWEKYVTQEFGQMAEPSRLHEALISLGQRIILTTNFDKLIEMCWENKLGSATHLPNIQSSINANIFKLLKDHSGKYLIKIHGTVDSPDTLIFSRSEYIRLAFGSVSYHAFIEMLLLNYTFLFVGFSMQDPAICSLMEMYTLRYPTARPHYIFVPENTPNNILSINRKLRKLSPITYDSSEHHAKLPDVITELASFVPAKRNEIFAEFIVSS